MTETILVPPELEPYAGPSVEALTKGVRAAILSWIDSWPAAVRDGTASDEEIAAWQATFPGAEPGRNAPGEHGEMKSSATYRDAIADRPAHIREILRSAPIVVDYLPWSMPGFVLGAMQGDSLRYAAELDESWAYWLPSSPGRGPQGPRARWWDMELEGWPLWSVYEPARWVRWSVLRLAPTRAEWEDALRGIDVAPPGSDPPDPPGPPPPPEPPLPPPADFAEVLARLGRIDARLDRIDRNTGRPAERDYAVSEAWAGERIERWLDQFNRVPWPWTMRTFVTRPITRALESDEWYREAVRVLSRLHAAWLRVMGFRPGADR